MTWISQLSERMFPNRADKYGSTRLHQAAAKGDRSRIVQLLGLGADPNARDQQGRTSLHVAASGGNVSCVEALISKKANVSQRDENGTQPIHYACKGGHAETVQTLLRHGASIEATDNSGSTCMHYAAMGDGTALMEYLLQEGQQTDERDRSGFTPLALACTKKNPSAVRFLLHHGANPNILCDNGYTPLTMAVLKPDASEEVIMALLEFGADPQLGKPDQPFPNAVAAAAMLAGSAETGAGIAGMLLALKRNADTNDPSLSLHSRLLQLFAEGKRVPKEQFKSTLPQTTPPAPKDTGHPPHVPSQEAREPEISEITEAEFNTLGPSVTRFSFPDECKKWFKAENGNIIAILIYDRIEKTWLGQVRIRIGNGEHQVGTWGYKMAGTPYKIFSASEAERTIKDTIKGILKGEEYNQVVDTPDGKRTTTSVTGVTYRRDSGMPANRTANSDGKT